MIDLPDLDMDFMVGTPEPEPPATPSPGPPAAEEPKKRHRRTKEQIAADNAAAAAAAKTPPAPLEFLPDNVTPSPFTPEHSEAAASVLGYQSAEQRERILAGEQPVARTQGSVEVDLKLDDNGKLSASVVPGSYIEEPLPDFGPLTPATAPAGDRHAVGWAETAPDAPDVQVLTDEIHFLRDDLRELASEIRKLALAMERSREVQEAPKS